MILQFSLPSYVGPRPSCISEDLDRLFALVDATNKHVHCCLDILFTTWSAEQTESAHKLLFGKTLGVSVVLVSKWQGFFSRTVLRPKTKRGIVGKILQIALFLRFSAMYVFII